MISVYCNICIHYIKWVYTFMVWLQIKCLFATYFCCQSQIIYTGHVYLASHLVQVSINYMCLFQCFSSKEVVEYSNKIEGAVDYDRKVNELSPDNMHYLQMLATHIKSM